ncbi:MAG: biopolymer transporter ExbD, partial [Candidatus Omnitrophica bacterium]|nr:biopolymer transporter ExbD [Candidatus Omnitrophota bacterium]
HGLGQIDIAPLIDIVFQLLIFFMLTSSFILQPGIEINLPKAVTSEIVEEENILITISGENIVYLNGKIVTFKELEKKLKKIIKKDQPLLIKADRRSSLGRVVEIWDLCREIGITKINIATDRSTY